MSTKWAMFNDFLAEDNDFIFFIIYADTGFFKDVLIQEMQLKAAHAT